MKTLSLRILAVNLPEHHPSNFSTLPASVLSALLEASVAQQRLNKVKSSRTKTLIRPVLTKKYLVKFETYTGSICPPDALELAWKCVVDEDFPPGSFDRPAVFSSTFTELVSTVGGQVARLQEIISDENSSKEGLRKSAMATLANFKKLPVSSKLLSETKAGKVLQRIVSRKYSSATNISKHGHDLAASLLESWKAAASAEVATSPSAKPNAAATAEESQLRDSILLSACPTYRDLYFALDARKAEIKSHTSKMKAHRDALSGKRKATKEVTTVMSRKAARRAEMLMGKAERDKQVAKINQGKAASSSGQKMSKLWREATQVSKMGRSHLSTDKPTSTQHVGKNPFTGKLSSKTRLPPKKGETRELSFPKGGGIFQEINAKKRLETARKSVTDNSL
ncbi:hypothetical protein TrRE_jg10321 [Triparma retinervis]|uniref:TFIIS N-terminal domain-containing protein n=1 Tax=Triparma retinervis TaxID=2557542 RepID=A0A9W7DWC5_9STRA|nr:hypothetical protein TrRE_jg10321 [Triparma retinervis]